MPHWLNHDEFGVACDKIDDGSGKPHEPTQFIQPQTGAGWPLELNFCPARVAASQQAKGIIVRIITSHPLEHATRWQIGRRS
jgi:hypothetical protein